MLLLTFLHISDFNYTIGCALAHIGALRIHLLLSYNEVDPAMKYYCKYAQLEETISSLELEIQVFQKSALISQIASQFSIILTSSLFSIYYITLYFTIYHISCLK
jgi:hypothetical protein